MSCSSPQPRSPADVDFLPLEPRLRELAVSAGASLKSVLLAAHVTVWRAVTGPGPFVTGLLCNGRPEVEGGDQVYGMFLNLVPYRPLRGDRTAARRDPRRDVRARAGADGRRTRRRRPLSAGKPPAKPRVALTLGIAATETFGGYTLDLQDVLDHLGGLDIEVAVIHHAGAATLATVSRYGVPQLSIPFHFDEPVIARKLAAQGAGLHLPTAEATGASVRAHLLRLPDEPVFAKRAAALAGEFDALPAPGALVVHLEELTAKHR